MDRYVGIDLGTSGLKVAVLADSGELVDSAEAPYPVHSPHPGWAESDPDSWLAAVDSALASLGTALAGIRAVGIAGQMHGAVVCSASGVPLRPAILWPDRRAGSVMARWHRMAPHIRSSLANPLVPGMTGPVVRWLLDNEPSTMDRAATVLLPKDYVRLAVGGTPVTDRSDASATLLWDVPADRWSISTLDNVGITASLLPAVMASASVDGLVKSGPLQGVPVVVGCADAAAVLLASSLGRNEVQVNLGTGIQVLRSVQEPWARADPLVHLYAAVPDGWYAMAAVQNGGLALDWVRRLFGLDWPSFFTMAGASSADGVSFLPFLTGERGGVAPQSARGAWIGMTERSTRDNLVRSALEGVAFCVRRGLDLLEASASPVLLSGGGARAPVMRQLLADVLGVPVRYEESRSASARGAAMLAASGVGGQIAPDPTARALSPVDVDRTSPAPELVNAYDAWLTRLTLSRDR